MFFLCRITTDAGYVKLSMDMRWGILTGYGGGVAQITAAGF